MKTRLLKKARKNLKVEYDPGTKTYILTINNQNNYKSLYLKDILEKVHLEMCKNLNKQGYKISYYKRIL